MSTSPVSNGAIPTLTTNALTVLKKRYLKKNFKGRITSYNVCYTKLLRATKEDHIAPWTSIYPTTGLLSGEVKFVLGGSGHIAGVINPPAGRPKYGYCRITSYNVCYTKLLRCRETPEGVSQAHAVLVASRSRRPRSDGRGRCSSRATC